MPRNHLQPDGTLRTTLYTKPTDTHSYLHPSSCHPKHTTRSIPYSQALRLRRICSHDSDYNSQSQQMHNWFTARGYDPDLVTKQMDKASKLPRETLLEYGQKSTQQRIPLVVTYHPSLPNLGHILHKHFYLLQATPPHLRKAFAKPPLLAFRQPANLKNILVRTREPVHGSGPCGKPRCTKCTILEAVTNTPPTPSIQVRGSHNCDSSNVVYMLYCTICPNPTKYTLEKLVSPCVSALMAIFTNYAMTIVFLPLHATFRHLVIHWKPTSNVPSSEAICDLHLPVEPSK